MVFPSYSKLEQKAILHLTAAVAYTDGWNENEKALLNAIGRRFNFSIQDTSAAIVMERQQAISIVKNLDFSKKKMVSCLFQSAAMADGDMRMGKPQWDIYYDFVEQCDIPMDISFSEALDLTHLYLGC